jgi:hypothetical protein
MKKLKTPTISKAMAWLCGLLCSSSCVIFNVLSLLWSNGNNKISKLRVPSSELK